MSEHKRKIEDLERRVKMLEEAERKHDLAIREHGNRLDHQHFIQEQHRAAVQPLLDERQAKTVTITIDRKDAEQWATGWSADDDGASELNRMIAAIRAALEGER